MTLRMALGAALLAFALPALAGRPFTTEDASVLDDKRCQVEAWIDRSRVATDSWFVPACNFGANIEWQMGFARRHAQDRSAFAEAYAQAKAVYPMPEASPWDVGLVLGVKHKPGPEHRSWANPYVLVPITVTPGESVAFHANAGTLRDHAARRNLTLWGMAAEVAVREALTLVGEVFGENAERPFVRLGARYTAIRDQLDVDLTFVTRPGGTREERFLSLGVTWQSGRFLP